MTLGHDHLHFSHGTCNNPTVGHEIKLVDDVTCIFKKMEEKISVYSTQSKYKLCLKKLLFVLFMFQLHGLG